MSAKLQVLGYGLLALFLLLGLASCQPPQPVRVGFLGSFSGGGAAIGVDGRDGALLAIEKINAEGGVSGREMELVIRDNLNTAEGAVSAAQELIDEGIFLIHAHMTSSLMFAAWEKTKDSGVLYLSPTASTSQLSRLDDNFLRVTPVPSIFALNLADYALSSQGLRRVAIFYDIDNAAFTEDYREAFSARFAEGGGEVVWEYSFSSSAKPDFKAALVKMEESKPDGVLMLASAVDAALISQQIRLVGSQAQLLASNWALTKDLIANGGKAVDGIAAIATYNEDNHSPQYVEFTSCFEERFGRRPSFSAGYGYETMLIIADALKKTAGGATGLKSALLQTSHFPGVFGDISLDPYGDVIRSLYLVEIQEGRFVTRQEFFAP